MRLMLSALVISALAGGAFAEDAPRPVSAGIKLVGPDGKDMGSASLKDGPSGIVLRIDASGLTPGWHGLHFHMVGDCGDGGAGFKMSGAHVGHGGDDVHGLLNPQGPELGDLPNLYAAADGTAHGEFYSVNMTIADLNDGDGTALVIHAAEDDHTSQPIGNAGDRVACGTVGSPQ